MPLFPLRLLRPTLFAFSGALALAPAASATWTASGNYSIEILTPGIEFVTAPEVQEADVMYRIFIGSTSSGGVTGEVTVSNEGDATERKTLGLWRVIYGTGNVDGVVGTEATFQVGNSAAAGQLPGVLNIIASDITLSSASVYQGTMNVQAGSDIGSVGVFDEASLNVTLGSQIKNLTTHEGGYARVEDSAVVGDSFCSQAGIVLVQDGAFACQSLDVELGGDMQVETLNQPYSTLDIANRVRVNLGSLDVASAIATSGSILVNGVDSHLHITATDWTNAGGLDIAGNSPAGPAEVTVSGGSRYHGLGIARVAGNASWVHLTVTGAGTEFETEGAMRIGETLISGNTYNTAGTVTVEDGATVIVRGALVIKPLGVLNLEPGATVYADSVDNGGTINENGGTLVLPEPGAMLSGVAALAALAGRKREATQTRR